jgi:D-alanyl-D-alanine carboxypeptidase
MVNKARWAIYIAIFFAGLIASCRKVDVQETFACNAPADSSAKHPKRAIYQDVIDKYVKLGLPGICVLIRDSSGTWVGSGGMADIDKKIPMQPCHIVKTASLTKIFMATLTMKLVEEGTLQLDEKISKWLPESILGKIENADKCTLRNLLNHTSGIYDVIIDQDFYLAVLNKPDRKWTQEELLKFVYGKPAAFETGTTSGYSNTNTLLVSMIIDKVTGRPHADLLREKILAPLGLNNTYYYWHDDLPLNGVAQGYFDLYNNGEIENLSNYNTGSGCGYTGLYSTVYDLQTFIEALVRNKTLLKPESLNEMLKFADNIESRKYLGMGIFKDFIDGNFKDDEFAYGHRGRDLAYSADMFYFPNQDVTLTLLVNYGTDAESKLRPVFLDFRYEMAAKAIH